MSEKNLQKKALEYLNSFDDCIAENVSGNANQSGRADINGCCRGQAFKIELKDPTSGYQPTEKQLFYLEQWAAAGCLCGICYSLDDISKMLDEYLNYCGDYLCIKCEKQNKCELSKETTIRCCKHYGHTEGCNPECRSIVLCSDFKELKRENKVFRGGQNE